MANNEHSPVPKTARQLAIRDALIAGVSTFVVDGVIQFFSLRGKTPIAVSVDSITNNAHTVLGSSVALALLLAVLLTVINYLRIKGPKIDFFPGVLWLIVRHVFFAFGVFTSLSVLWQRLFGTVEIGLLPAVFVIALIAGLVSATVNYLTIKACSLPRTEEGGGARVPT
jgi:hypothetical protein